MSKMFVKQDGNLFDILSKDRAFISKLKKVDAGYKNEKGSVSKCWEWQGAYFQNGYGRLGTPVDTKGESIHRTHRYAYYLANGKIKKSRSILHKCDNRICCNPKHLYQGDHRQNMRDMTARSRQARGETSGRAVFIEEDISAIRFFYKVGFTLSNLMVMYDSAKSTMGNIINRRVWTHVSDKKISEKGMILYIKSRKKRKCALIAPVLKKVHTSTLGVKRCDVHSIRMMVGVFGQEGFAKMIGSSRKKIRVILESPDDTELLIDPSTGDINLYVKPKGDVTLHHIVELIQSI